MLITIQKHLSGDSFFFFFFFLTVTMTFSNKQLQWKECDKEFVPAQEDRDEKNGGCCRKQDASASKHRVSSYVGPCEFMCESKSQGEKPFVSLVRMERKQAFHM